MMELLLYLALWTAAMGAGYQTVQRRLAPWLGAPAALVMFAMLIPHSFAVQVSRPPEVITRSYPELALLALGGAGVMALFLFAVVTDRLPAARQTRRGDDMPDLSPDRQQRRGDRAQPFDSDTD